ncbi:FMN-linked oxidoreductase [Leucogyrophana mollusca]|uniref:FMN-linked oxidoreductase n=1 Tax=Leucogyrophana mollusca TaxID=85980 RepID=A0ACB8BY68_9AGAM|nr:FMN-linked oxidoreductase [Leucogyrophana mollusca]
MVRIRSIEVSPSLVNCSCAWASDLSQLQELYHCQYTGAVITRTATLAGFAEDSSHTVAFLKDSLSSLNSYGYSPHSLATYLSWIRTLLEQDPSSSKPFIISISDSSPVEIAAMLDSIQVLRKSQPGWQSRVAVEFNPSCPNIKGHPPPSYHFSGVSPFLDVFAKAFWEDESLTIGLKLPPYVASTQFTEVIDGIAAYTRLDPSGQPRNPFAYFTCTNTLGNSLVFSELAVDGGAGVNQFAVPPGLGGLAGEAIHSLSLGNVYSFARLLAESDDPAMREIVIIGAGGVTTPEAVERMHRAGAKAVGCATLLGKEGVAAFQRLAGRLAEE